MNNESESECVKLLLSLSEKANKNNANT